MREQPSTRPTRAKCGACSRHMVVAVPPNQMQPLLAPAVYTSAAKLRRRRSMRQTADGIAKAIIALPDEAARGFAETRAVVLARSVIAWGEHCTECAFPACY